MLSRVPRKFKDAGAPKLLSFSLKYPPFVAVCIGDNYMLVFGTSGQHVNEDVGLTFPDDYVSAVSIMSQVNIVSTASIVSIALSAPLFFAPSAP